MWFSRFLATLTGVAGAGQAYAAIWTGDGRWVSSAILTGILTATLVWLADGARDD